MARKRHTAEQIIHKLRKAEVALSQGRSPSSGLSLMVMRKNDGRGELY